MLMVGEPLIGYLVKQPQTWKIHVNPKIRRGREMNVNSDPPHLAVIHGNDMVH